MTKTKRTIIIVSLSAIIVSIAAISEDVKSLYEIFFVEREHAVAPPKPPVLNPIVIKRLPEPIVINTKQQDELNYYIMHRAANKMGVNEVFSGAVEFIHEDPPPAVDYAEPIKYAEPEIYQAEHAENLRIAHSFTHNRYWHSHGARTAVIPEPDALPLLVSGLLVLALVRRRKRIAA